jgi:CheY-like chemotaxis protein
MESTESIQTKNILMIEDSIDDFIIAKRTFTKAGVNLNLYHCLTGEDGLDFLFKRGKYVNSAESIQLLLLDLNLPGIDGHEVIRRIKSDTTFCKLPIIVLTTSHNLVDIDKAYTLGASSYICKPVTLEGFIDAVKNLSKYWFETVYLWKQIV